jgi:hypothetical protein
MDLHQVKLKNNHSMFSTCIYYPESWQLYFGKMFPQTIMEAHNIDDLKLCSPKQKQKKSAWEDIVKLPLPHLTYHVSHTHMTCVIFHNPLVSPTKEHKGDILKCG